ncbi:unnamed protein product, partial [Aureobasidium pullulans]
RRRGCSCQPRRLFRYDTSDRRLEVNLLSFSTLLRGPRSRPHRIRTWRTKEEPGNGSPAQTSSTTSESYYPEVREEGEIPIRFFDTTNGQLPSFFYAPRDDLDLDWSLEPFDYLFRTELEQFESVLHHLHDLNHPQDFNHAPALFVRDNVAGVNLLYSGSPHIYRYND